MSDQAVTPISRDYPRYVGLYRRSSAGDRLRHQLWDRKWLALERQRRLHFLTEQPQSTTHEPHCCRPKPRDLLMRRRPMTRAWERAYCQDVPF